VSSASIVGADLTPPEIGIVVPGSVSKCAAETNNNIGLAETHVMAVLRNQAIPYHSEMVMMTSRALNGEISKHSLAQKSSKVAATPYTAFVT
jgi:hypothetical protein